MLGPQVAHAGGHVLLPGCQRESRKVGLHDDVGKAALPVTEFEVGQHHLSDVPAEEHVTLGKALLQRVEEVFGGHAFAAVNAFDVGGADLDVLDLALVNQLFDLCYFHTVHHPFSCELCNSVIACSTSAMVFRWSTFSAISESS